MSNTAGYKALLIRADARSMVDQARNVYEECNGIKLNYSQFITFLCMNYIKSEVPQQNFLSTESLTEEEQ